MEHNLAKYLAKHPECEVFCGQDAHDEASSTRSAIKMTGPARPTASVPPQKRVTLWHRFEKRKVVGNAAPLERNVAKYLAKHPEYEVYDANGHEREKDVQRAVEKVLSAIVTSVANQHRQSAAGAGRMHGADEGDGFSRKRKGVSAGSKRWHISGGKRPEDACRATKRRATVLEQCSGVSSSTVAGVDHTVTSVDRCDGLLALAECPVGFSLLLHVASHNSAQAQVEVSRDLLDLLVKATDEKARPKDAQFVDVATPDASDQPESPPFSPMMGPVDTVAAMEELCLSAPSPKAKKIPFHQLRPCLSVVS